MDNFTAIRNGLDEHFEEGKFTPYDMGVYYVILRQCDWKTGIWKGSAAKIVAAYGFSPDLRDVQRSMHRLREIQMINYRDGRGQNRGKRGNYPVLIHHYKPQKGAYSGMRLNAFAPGSLEHPVYEPCVVSDVLSDVVSASIQDVRSKITDENRENTKASSGDDVPFSNSSSNLSPIKNNGRPLLTEKQVEYTKALSVEYGLPAPEAPDYAKAAQFFDRCDDVEILEAFLANFREGEDFKTVGDLFVAALGHANYLGYSSGLAPGPAKAPVASAPEPNCSRCNDTGKPASYSTPGKLVVCECTQPSDNFGLDKAAIFGLQTAAAMPQPMSEEQSRDRRQVLRQQAESWKARRP